MTALAILLLTISSTLRGDPPAGPGPAAGAAPPAHTVSVEQVIEALVADLGADRYDVRERATESLRHIGQPALPVLERAAESDDPEVRMRARDILRDVRLGIKPDWPSEMILLVRHYEQLTDNERPSALQRLGQALGVRAVPFLIQRLASEGPREGQYAFMSLQRMTDDEAARQVLALIPEPKTAYQTQAVGWARSRLVFQRQMLRLMVAGGPDDPLRNDVIEAGVKRVRALLKERQYEEAARSAREMADAAADEPRFPYLAAEAHLALDRPDGVQALREKALAASPNDEARHVTAARLLEELGRRRLAAAEWEAVLKIPPADGVGDINANLGLAFIYEASGLFDRAAKSLQTAWEQFQKARQAGEGVALAHGTEEDLQMRLQQLTRMAGRYPPGGDADIEDEIAENELRVHIAILVKNNQGDDLQRRLAAANASVMMDVQPEGLRLFEDVPIALRYDPARKELLALLGESRCGKPAPLDLSAAGPEARLAVTSLDRCFLFSVNTATGEMKESARFEKDYVITFQPGVRLQALTDATVKINGKRYGWDEMLKGIPFDFLPKALDVIVEGTTPAGRRITARVQLNIREPPVPPPANAGPDR